MWNFYVYARDRALSSLVDLVTETIITCPMTVTNLKDLCSRYVEFLRREGVEEVSYPSYCLKARLVSHFGDALGYHRPQKRNVT